MKEMTVAEMIEYLKTLNQEYRVMTADYEGNIGEFTKESITEQGEKTYVIC